MNDEKGLQKVQASEVEEARYEIHKWWEQVVWGLHAAKVIASPGGDPEKS